MIYRLPKSIVPTLAIIAMLGILPRYNLHAQKAASLAHETTIASIPVPPVPLNPLEPIREDPAILFNLRYQYTSATAKQKIQADFGLVSPPIVDRLALLPGISTQERFKGSALGGSIGIEYDTAGTSRIRWRASLVDLDAVEVGSSDPYTLGLTLLDYDKSGLLELDARWAQIRGGVLLSDLDQFSRYFMHGVGNLSAGITTVEPGTRNYSHLGSDMDHSLTGIEGGATLSIGPGYQFTRRYLHVQTLLSLDLRVRTISSERGIQFYTIGSTWLTGLPMGYQKGILLAIRAYREFARYNTREQSIDNLEFGLTAQF